MDYGDKIGNWEVIEISKRKVGFKNDEYSEYYEEQYYDVNIEGLRNEKERVEKATIKLQNHMHHMGVEKGKREMRAKFKELMEL